MKMILNNVSDIILRGNLDAAVSALKSSLRETRLEAARFAVDPVAS